MFVDIEQIKRAQTHEKKIVMNGGDNNKNILSHLECGDSSEK